MSIIYELKVWSASIHKDFNTLEAAQAEGEQHPHAEVITWNEHPNLPFALPKMVRNSCALHVWEIADKKWKMINIF